MRFEFERKDRRGFLKQVAKTAAVGLGIALYPAVRANATTQAPVKCCALSGRCPPCEPLSDASLWCDSLQCCVCEADGLDEDGCYTSQFPPCPTRRPTTSSREAAATSHRA